MKTLTAYSPSLTLVETQGRQCLIWLAGKTGEHRHVFYVGGFVPRKIKSQIRKYEREQKKRIAGL